MDIATLLPYCGLPPLPSELWTRWNLDPWLIGALALAFGIHVQALRRGSAGSGLAVDRRLYFSSGWLLLAGALISPLCALSVSLFSARVAQHMLITMIVAPLLVAASRSLVSPRINASIGAALFAITLWAWHLPRLYELTFASDAAYWAMHLSLLGAALLLWRGILLTDAASWLARIGAGFLTLIQMGLLGALIAFAPRPLYTAHLLTTEAWGLSALEDQELGGVIMWIPASLTLLIAALWIVYKLLTSGVPSAIAQPAARTDR